VNVLYRRLGGVPHAPCHHQQRWRGGRRWADPDGRRHSQNTSRVDRRWWMSARSDVRAPHAGWPRRNGRWNRQLARTDVDEPLADRRQSSPTNSRCGGSGAWGEAPCGAARGLRRLEPYEPLERRELAAVLRDRHGEPILGPGRDGIQVFARAARVCSTLAVSCRAGISSSWVSIRLTRAMRSPIRPSSRRSLSWRAGIVRHQGCEGQAQGAKR
jgi:hypothetical protein